MKKWIVAVAILGVAAGCSEKNTLLAKAHIIERKALANGKVRVNYVFETGERRLVKDSADVDSERVVPHDSVSIKFSAVDPHKNQIQLP